MANCSKIYGTTSKVILPQLAGYTAVLFATTRQAIITTAGSTNKIWSGISKNLATCSLSVQIAQNAPFEGKKGRF